MRCLLQSVSLRSQLQIPTRKTNPTLTTLPLRLQRQARPRMQAQKGVGVVVLKNTTTFHLTLFSTAPPLLHTTPPAQIALKQSPEGPQQGSAPPRSSFPPKSELARKVLRCQTHASHTCATCSHSFLALLHTKFTQKRCVLVLGSLGSQPRSPHQSALASNRAKQDNHTAS